MIEEAGLRLQWHSEGYYPGRETSRRGRTCCSSVI